MRSLFGILLLIVVLVPPLSAQESKKGFEFNFSLIHPVKRSLSEYKFSTDPTLEVLYFTSLSKKIWVAGGLFAQAGKHNWLENTGHSFTDIYGIPYPLRTDYNRQLEFFSLGIPVKIGLSFNDSFFNSFFLGFTAGNHLKLEMADYYNSKFVANIPVYPYYPYYKSVFWELNFGFEKIIYNKKNFALSLSPVAGYRRNTSKDNLTFVYYVHHDLGRHNYFFYGLGLIAKFRK
jgi:hypothetical protein